MMKFEEWLFLTLGLAIGALGLLTVQSACDATKIPDGLGALIGGVFGGAAAVASATVAWKGFTRWETRHRKERQAEVAGAALVAARRLCIELGRVAAEEPPPGGSVPRDFYAHWHTTIKVALADDRWVDAQDRVAAYLPDTAGAALEALIAVANETSTVVAVACFSCGFSNDPPTGEHEAEFKHAAATLPQRVTAAFAVVKSTLQPFALIGAE